jgi:general nucleoside transport system permease protein
LSKEPINPSQPAHQEESPRSFWQRLFVRKGTWGGIILPILAVFTALVIGGLIIAFTDLNTLAAWGNFFHDPLGALSATWATIRDSYSAMFIGAFGDPAEIIKQLGVWLKTGENKALLDAIRPFSDSLVVSVPYILAGLGVAIGFQCNLFNIGAEGQLYIGGLATAYIGYAVHGLPWYIHAPLAIAAGALAAGIWGFIPGILKARFGAHEVINTIMMNYIAFRLTDYLLAGPMKAQGGIPATPEVQSSAILATIFPSPVRLHWGFFIALGLAVVVYWLLYKTTFGMELRMVGANPKAAKYAGISVSKTMALTMAISAALCGLAGSIHLLGVDHRMVRAFSPGYGFDAIALALLGNSHPFGVVVASLLFGFLRGGAARMQSVAGTPVEIIRIIQGLVIVFIAAPEIIRGLYHLRASKQQKKIAQTSISES